MNVDEALQSLRDQPKPEPSAFFAAKVMHAAQRRAPRRTPIALLVYWLLFIAFTASLLLPTTLGAPLAVLAIGAAVFPEKVLGMIAPLLR